MKSSPILRGNPSASLSSLFLWTAKILVLPTLFILLLYILFYGVGNDTYIRRPMELSTQPGTIFQYSDFNESLKHIGKSFWDNMKPGFTCPEHLLVRAGAPKPKDGGKWTCGINNLAYQQNCLVYSFGVNKDSSFEAEVLATTHCTVYAYDPKVDKIGSPLKSTNPRAHFKKMGINNNDTEILYHNVTESYRTLKTLMKENGNHQWIDILKIDVEGAEYRSLKKVIEDFSELPFGQLLLEVHVKNWNVTGTLSQAEMVADFFQSLESKGLRMFTYEVNMLARKGYCCCEVSFLNTKMFALNTFLDANKK